MRVILTILFLVASLSSSAFEVKAMDDLSAPPWDVANDETIVADSSIFSQCDDVLKTFVSQAKGLIKSRTYSISKQWGSVLRAKAELPFAGVTTTTLITCWSKSGSGVEIVVKVEGTDDLDAPTP